MSAPEPGVSGVGAGGLLPVGARLGPYRILGLLGQGGMGAVYDALHEDLQRPVALKTLLDPSGSAEEAQRFLLEAQALGRLDHPNVVRLYDAAQAGGLRYMAMEKVEGESMAELLREGPLPAPEAVRIVAEIAEGVGAAHALRILHRDLKPDNILISRSGTPRLTDFGLARVDGRHMTQTGEVLGTPCFMAPEQAQGERERLGPWTDVYGLGAVLYAALGGRAPYQERGAMFSVLAAIVSAEPEPLPRSVPADLRAVVRKAMQREPEARYPSAAELREDLLRFQAGAPVAARPPGTIRRWARALRAQLVVVVTSAALSAGLCALGLFAAQPYLAGRSEAALVERAEAWRAEELRRLSESLPEAPGLLRERIAALEVEALVERGALALAIPSASRGLLRRALVGGWDEAKAPLLARLYLGLGGAGDVAALTSAAILAPESSAGREARLELARRLLARRGGTDSEALRAGRALLETLAAAQPADPVAQAARTPLARLRAGALDWGSAGALLSEGEPSPEEAPLRALVAVWGESRSLEWEQGEALSAALEPGWVTAWAGGARLRPRLGPARDFAPPRAGLRLQACAWGPLRAQRSELSLLWSGAGAALWEGVDLADRSADEGRAILWEGSAPAGLKSSCFGDLDGDGRLDAVLVGWEGAAQSKAILAASRRELPLFGPAAKQGPYAFASALALDLDGSGGAELVLTPSELSAQHEVRVLALKGRAFETLAALPLGPVASARVLEGPRGAQALLTIDRQPGARSWGLGALEQEGHALLGWGREGAEFSARWVQAGPVGDAARHAYESLAAWVVEVEGQPCLVRGWAAPDAAYWLEAARLSELQADPARAPSWRLRVAEPPLQRPQALEAAGLIWGGRSYEPMAETPPLGAIQGSAWPSSPSRRLAWAAQVLRLLEAPGAEDLLEVLRERAPESAVAKEAVLAAARAGLAEGRRLEGLALTAFLARRPAEGREVWGEARGAYRAAALAAERLAEEAPRGEWVPPRARALALAGRAWFGLAEFERAGRATALALAEPELPATLREHLARERARLEPARRWRELSLPLDLRAPGLAISPRCEALPSGALALRVSAEDEEGWLVPIQDPGATWELRAELELGGSAWCASFDLGISESLEDGALEPLAGVRVNLWDVFSVRPGVAPWVGGRQTPGHRYLLPSFGGRVGVTLLVFPRPEGTDVLVELRDAEGRLMLRDCFATNRTWAPRGRLFLGLRSASSQPGVASQEQQHFGQASWVTLHSLSLRAPQAVVAELPLTPRFASYRGHAEWARGDLPAALEAYRAGIEAFEATPAGREGVAPLRSPTEADLGRRLLFFRGLARHGVGDRLGYRDLVEVFRQAPDQGIALLESLASGAPGAFEREAVQAALQSLASDSGDSLLRAVALRFWNQKVAPMPAPPAGDLRRLRAYLRLQAVLEGGAAAPDSARARLQALAPGEQVPRSLLPRVWLPPTLARGQTLEGLLAGREEAAPLAALQRARQAVAHAPQDPRCWCFLGISLFKLSRLGLAADAAHEALRLRPSAGLQIQAHQILGTQATRLHDSVALRAHLKALEDLAAPEELLRFLRARLAALESDPR